jgi:hypothetical protein
MASGHIVATGPTEFFRDLVQSAMQAQNFEPATEETEHYLVLLLERHVRGHRALLQKPLGVSYLEAVHTAPPESIHRFQTVGDTALFLVGIFTESFERSLVQPGYYIELGQMAYTRIADLSNKSLRDLFAALAEQFRALVGVLGEISARDLFGTDRDTLRIYRRWLVSRAPADADRLVRMGVIPGEPSRSRH